MTMINIPILILLLSVWNVKAQEETCDNGKWGEAVSSTKCTSDTKQKAMYGSFTFQPSLSEKPYTALEVDVEWNTWMHNPCHTTSKGKIISKGGVYAAYLIKVKEGPGGYFGAQLTSKKAQYIFSIWDAGRKDPEGPAGMKAASKLSWPIDMKHCKRNCQDCGSKAPKKLGLTTGTKCTVRDVEAKVGNRFKLTLKQLQKQMTINTADYGGFPKGHIKYLNETNRNVTGGLWEIVATQVTKDGRPGRQFQVGKILFEGEGFGMTKLTTFDEMIGCNSCNSIQHKDTRYGHIITAEDGTTRKPIRVRGSTKYNASTCKKYLITGSKKDTSISFEGGPLTENPFPGPTRRRIIWE